MRARTMVDYPESTYIGYPTASISIGLSTTYSRHITSRVTLQPPPTPSASPSGRSSNTGPIVGGKYHGITVIQSVIDPKHVGVVGGAAAIALAAAAVFMWKKRHQGHEGSSIRQDGRIDMAESAPDNASPPIPPVTESNQIVTPAGFSLTSSQLQWKKLYDPNDPSTFPPTPSPSGIIAQERNPFGYTNPTSGETIRYTGAAEI
ncbi:hypothetical protein FRC03_012709 [Tulasnella sp. 419]|nr:hypothetical protein FRC03_012709 [Tulasnella sp. 419]